MPYGDFVPLIQRDGKVDDKTSFDTHIGTSDGRVAYTGLFAVMHGSVVYAGTSLVACCLVAALSTWRSEIASIAFGCGLSSGVCAVAALHYLLIWTEIRKPDVDFYNVTMVRLGDWLVTLPAIAFELCMLIDGVTMFEKIATTKFWIPVWCMIVLQFGIVLCVMLPPPSSPLLKVGFIVSGVFFALYISSMLTGVFDVYPSFDTMPLEFSTVVYSCFVQIAYPLVYFVENFVHRDSKMKNTYCNVVFCVLDVLSKGGLALAVSRIAVRWN